MATGALFGNTGSRTSSKNLVEFRAGKMYMKEKMVHPDKRKGQVYVYQSDDSLMHFCWKDRTSGSVEDVVTQARGEIFRSASNIVEDILQDEVEPNDFNLPRPSYLVRIANRARQKLRPQEPTDLDFEIDYNYLNCRDFIIGDVRVDGQRHIICATQQQLTLLRQARRWYLDGTFKIRKEPFEQLFSIHAFLEKDQQTKQVPLCFVLMSRRRAQDYTADLIIFPDDIEFKHVTQCTTGRVYVLKFKSSTRKFFFWMQEPKTDKDEENCKKVNEYLNNPPTPGSNRGGGGLPPELSGLGSESDLQNILGGMSQQQLMQLLGGMGMGGPGGGLSALMGARPGSAQSTASEPPLRVQSSPGTRGTGGSSATSDALTTSQPARPVTAAALPSQQTTNTTASGQPTAQPTSGGNSAPSASGNNGSNTSRQAIQLSDLQNILSNMKVPGAAAKEEVDLVHALNPESMIPILANKDVQERLTKYLPEGESLPKTEAELRNTVSSPQFQQALSSFSAALQSGQLGPLMSQFGLGEDVANAAAQGDLEAFVKAMQENKKKSDDKEEKMDAD